MHNQYKVLTESEKKQEKPVKIDLDSFNAEFEKNIYLLN